ncbi:MAG: hypothetical protein QM703_15740 [Gemmatales bacterium]
MMQSLQWDSILDRMTTARRFLNLKTIAIVATLLFVVAYYFGARKVMVSGVEPGMSRAEILKILGEPSKDIRMNPPAMIMDRWDTIQIGSGVLDVSVYVTYDVNDRATAVGIISQVFGRSFQHIRQ